MMLNKKVLSVFVLIVILLGFSVTGFAKTEINVFTAYGGKDEIFSAFEEATGIKVNYLSMSSGEVLARIRGEEGSPSGDVWFGGGSDAFIAAKKDGILQKYISPESEHIPDLYKDKDGYWTAVSLVTVNFIINKELCDKKGIVIPRTWEEVAKEEFKGEIMMSDPSISGTAYTIISGLLQHKGEKDGWEFFEKLNKNIPYYAKRGSEPPQKAALGEVIVGLSPGTGVELKAEGYPVVNVMPEDGTPWWPAPVAIIKGTDNLEGAKIFIDWVLSEDGQKILRENCPRIPAREGLEPPPELIGFKDATIMNIDFEKAGARREEIVEKWKKEYAK